MNDPKEFKSQFGIPAVAAPLTYGKNVRQAYDGKELGPATHRPGAMDAYVLPSRFANRLHYRDGRVLPVQC